MLPQKLPNERVVSTPEIAHKEPSGMIQGNTNAPL